MAIEKAKTLRSGVVGNYWKITSERYDRLSDVFAVSISLFLDRASSQAGKTPLDSKGYTFNVTKEEMAGNRTALAYGKVKEKAASIVQNINYPGTHVFDTDLADGVDV